MARPTGRTKSVTPPRARPAGTAHRLPRIARIAQRLGRMIPEEELRRMPKDLSSQIDHYVYLTQNKGVVYGRLGPELDPNGLNMSRGGRFGPQPDQKPST